MEKITVLLFSQNDWILRSWNCIKLRRQRHETIKPVAFEGRMPLLVTFFLCNLTFTLYGQNVWAEMHITFKSLSLSLFQNFNRPSSLSSVCFSFIVNRPFQGEFKDTIKGTICKPTLMQIFFNMGQSNPLFVYFNPFHITIKILIWKSVDVMLGIRTWGQRVVGADGSTDLWRPPMMQIIEASISVN